MSNYTMKYKPTGAHCQLEMHIQHWQNAVRNRDTDEDERVYVSAALEVAHHAIYMLTSGYELVHGNHTAELEAENNTLRQQVAAMQAAQAREPVPIEWKEHRTRYSFDDLIADALNAASNVSGDVVGEE